MRLHDLRHTFASYGAAAGLGLPVLGAILGHRNQATTARYAHLADDPRRAGAALISGGIAAALNSHPKGDAAGAAV
jgi:integrase